MSEEDNNQEDEKPVNLEVKCAYTKPVVNENSGYESKLAYRCEFEMRCPLEIEFYGTGFCGAQLNPKKYRVDPNKKTIVKPGKDTFRQLLDLSNPKDPEDQLP